MEEKADSLTHLMNEIITRLFIEQPLALPGSAKNIDDLALKSFRPSCPNG